MFRLDTTAAFALESRRRVLRAGFLGLGGLSLASLLQLESKRPSNPFLPVWIVFGPVNSGFRTFSGEVRYERAGAGLA